MGLLCRFIFETIITNTENFWIRVFVSAPCQICITFVHSTTKELTNIRHFLSCMSVQFVYFIEGAVAFNKKLLQIKCGRRVIVYKQFFPLTIYPRVWKKKIEKKKLSSSQNFYPHFHKYKLFISKSIILTIKLGLEALWEYKQAFLFCLLIVCFASTCDNYNTYMDFFERFGTIDFFVAIDVEDWRNMVLVCFLFFVPYLGFPNGKNTIGFKLPRNWRNLLLTYFCIFFHLVRTKFFCPNVDQFFFWLYHFVHHFILFFLKYCL